MIEVWSEFEAQLRTNVRNNEVYKRMEDRLKDMDVHRNSKQINAKIKNLKHQFKINNPG